jgi:hypothetical protein
MNGTYLNRFILAVAIACGTLGCASSEPQAKASESKASSRAQPERTADAYVAEALATYQLQRDGARALNLMAAAAKQAPTRADIAYAQASLCETLEGCGPEPFEARLRKLDPGNAVVWMRALSAAQRARDTAVEGQILDAMGRSERFDLYWNRLAANLTLTRSVGKAVTEAALSETIGWMSATIVPDFQVLTQTCARARTGEIAWADRCRRVARVLLNGDTYIAESVGLAIAKQVTADPIELSNLDARARTSRYLWRTAADLIAAQVERDKFASEQVELMSKLRREQDMHLAIVRWSGRPVIPPSDFRMDE